MNRARESGASAAGERSLGRRILIFPLTRIVVFVVAVGGALFVLGVLLNTFTAGLSDVVRGWLSVVLSLPLAHVVYVTLVRWVERREPLEAGFDGAIAETARGALAGALIFTTIVAILWLLGVYQVVSVRGVGAMNAVLVASLLAGYIEELIFRGILFRIVEESLGSWLALAISSGLFGLAHIVNPNATWISTIAIVVEAGILLGAVYMWTGRIWYAAGMHFAWNMTQGGIFGIRVSGSEMGGLLESRLTGPELLSGGAFGAEASVVGMLVGLAAGVLFLRMAISAGRVRPPYWRR